jgi:hypothetical protein
MVTLKINGKKIQFPTHSNELTLAQLQDITTNVDFNKIEEDWIKLFNILSKSSYSITNIETELKLLNIMGWCLGGIVIDEFMPRVIKYKDKDIAIPTNIGNLSIGQAIALKQSIQRFKYMDEGISKAVSIYLQPIIDSKAFSLERAMEIEKELLDMSAFILKPLGVFILGQLQTNGILTMNPRKVILISLRKQLKNLQLIWQIVVVWPVTGIYHLLYGTLNFFRSILITFTKVAHSILFVAYSTMKRKGMSLMRGTPNITTL